MADLHARFRALDDLRAPDLWTDIETRSVTAPRSPQASLVVLVAAAAVLVLALVGRSVVDRASVGGPPPSPTPSPASTPTPAGWTRTGSMLTLHRGPMVSLADGRVLAAGGPDAQGKGVDSSELYDPTTGSWTSTGGMIQGRGGHSATVLRDGRVLVVGGFDVAVNGRVLASAELYDARTGSWAATGSMTQPRVTPTATLLADGRVLVAGGDGDGNWGLLASAELYDPGTGAWTPTGSMTEARRGHTATLLADGRVLVTGGTIRQAGVLVGGYVDLASAELYDPATGSWTATSSMHQAGSGRTATVLQDGTVLVVGSGGMVMYATGEIYDPGTESWTETGNLVERRGGHSATLLPDGRVLLVGGANGTGDHHVTSTAELYDPTTRSWTATASLAVPRKGHAAFLLPDGTVLVAGGTDGPTSQGWHWLVTTERYSSLLGN
jgi:N-acetylneuraminic acid mutarotase